MYLYTLWNVKKNYDFQSMEQLFCAQCTWQGDKSFSSCCISFCCQYLLRMVEGGTGYLFVLDHLEKLLFRPIPASQRQLKSSHMTNMLRF